MKVLFLILLCISLCYADGGGGSSYLCRDFYYGVESGQPIAAGYIQDYYSDDNGEYYADEDFKASVTQYDNGTYVTQGTYKQKVLVSVYNKYLGCGRQIYQDKNEWQFSYTRKGVRDPSLIGQNFTKYEVSPYYNGNLKLTLQGFAASYFQNTPQPDPYILQTLESMAQRIQVNYNNNN
ncbi:hypothetical protein ABPG74_005187 [Tetrahymena malaccensis]